MSWVAIGHFCSDCFNRSAHPGRSKEAWYHTAGQAAWQMLA
ncbi:sarcosine oxidase subunit delta [Aquitalea magnusonii]|uniref:Sarcosine oxidase subunit delta n=1 Tax=Aquitalea aquatica TaxID=3044273 RepID=A0A838Y671_9NEIS|nr:sarcosine oxidase subunit delta [Aquitalea magnusonii]